MRFAMEAVDAKVGGIGVGLPRYLPRRITSELGQVPAAPAALPEGAKYRLGTSGAFLSAAAQ